VRDNITPTLRNLANSRKFGLSTTGCLVKSHLQKVWFLGLVDDIMVKFLALVLHVTAICIHILQRASMWGCATS
jgi:hypothetical protein